MPHKGQHGTNALRAMHKPTYTRRLIIVLKVDVSVQEQAFLYTACINAFTQKNYN